MHDDDDYTQGVKALISVVLYAITNGVGVAVFCGIMHMAVSAEFRSARTRLIHNIFQITISPGAFQVTRAALKMGIYILADALAVFLAVLMLALAVSLLHSQRHV